MADLKSESVLPALRKELQLKPGIRELDGSKTWTLFDPLRHLYFQLDNKNLQILNCWSEGTAGDIVERLKDSAVTLDDIEGLLRFLWKNSLTVMPPNNQLDFFMAQFEKKSQKPIQRLLHGYLFVRLPLFRPHRFLKKTEPLSRVFFTRTYWFFVVLCALVGLFLTSRQWDQFVHTFSHFFSLEGLIYYGLALAFVKCLHELGHGYAATRYGCRITTMGIALIVLIPVLFTDTTDSWKLTSRRKRLIITGAGVAVELSLAAIATLMWAFLEDGPLRSTAFFVATTSWTMSLLINLNPLMRFDAYHFLSDALGVQNLQSRSFEFGRWRLRETLFGLGEPPPEAMFNHMRRGLTVFAWMTWIYRFFLFLGIALLIHSFLFRPFGSVLAGIEILFFIAIPIMNEMKQWWLRKAQILASPSSWVSASVVAVLLMALLVPWQSTIRMPAVIESAQQAPLFSPGVAQISHLHVKSGEYVQQGDTLISLESASLNNQIVEAQRRIELMRALLNRVAADVSDRGQKIVHETELRQWQEALAGLQEEKDLLKIAAPFDGVVAEISSDLHQGRWVSDQTRLGTLVTQTKSQIRGYVSAADLGRIGEGGEALFIPDVPEQQRTTGVISIVDTANAQHLTIPELTSHYDGAIAVNKVDDKLEPLKAWYHISVEVNDETPAVSQAVRGTLLAQGAAESLALRFWRRAVHVILREVVI